MLQRPPNAGLNPAPAVFPIGVVNSVLKRENLADKKSVCGENARMPAKLKRVSFVVFPPAKVLSTDAPIVCQVGLARGASKKYAEKVLYDQTERLSAIIFDKLAFKGRQIKQGRVYHLTLGQGAPTAIGWVRSGAWQHPHCRQLSLGTRSTLPAQRKIGGIRLVCCH